MKASPPPQQDIHVHSEKERGLTMLPQGKKGDPAPAAHTHLCTYLSLARGP